MLRYGDGTSFPFGENFLDLLVDAVEACTTMLAATADLDLLRAEAASVLQRIGEDERQLVMFERAVAAVCGPGVDPALATPASLAVEQTRLAMASAVERSREQLKQLSVAKASPPDWHETADRVHAAAGTFFERHALPETGWTWSWDASGPEPRAEAISFAARFHVVFDLDLAPPWRAPVPLGALLSSPVMHLPRRRRFRPPVEAALPLDRCTLVYARHDATGRELVIRQPTGWSWQLTFPDGGQPTATLLDRRGRAAGTGLVREPEMLALIRAIDDAFPVPHLPRHARAVSLAGTHLTSISDTTLAPRALLALLGPTVREIRERSRMPGELTLKRDIADNRREELYISRTNLTARYADLPAEHRILLDDAGFGRGLTTHLAELSQPELPSRPSPPPVAARASSPTIPARPSPSSRSPSTSMHTVQIPTLSMPAAEKPRRREADRPLRSILTVQPLPKPLALPIANRRILTPTG